MIKSLLNEKRFHFYLASFFLLLSLAAKLISISTADLSYQYDEYVVTQISRQPIIRLLDTVISEPHPPGFYLFLKLLPTINQKITKSFISIFSSTIIFLALVFAHKTKLLKKYKLGPGLALFFSSFTFISITGSVKQDSLSFPLIFLGLTLILHYFDKNKVISFVAATVICIILALIGYINFAFLFLFVFLAFIFTPKKTKLHYLFFSLPILTGILFFISYGSNQLLYNIGRFKWIYTFSNTIISALITHVSGNISLTFFSDIAIIILFTLLYLYTKSVKKTTFDKSVIMLTTSFFILAVLTRATVRVRYIAVPMLLLSIIVGKGLLKQHIMLAFLTPMLFLMLACSSYHLDNLNAKKWYQEYMGILKKIDQDTNQQTGHIFNHSSSHLPTTLFFPTNFKNLKLINLQHQDYSYDQNTISKEALSISSVYKNMTTQDIKTLLRKTDLSAFLYTSQIQKSVFSQTATFDNKSVVLRTLSTYCLSQHIYPFENQLRFLMLFTNCNFK